MFTYSTLLCEILTCKNQMYHEILFVLWKSTHAYVIYLSIYHHSLSLYKLEIFFKEILEIIEYLLLLPPPLCSHCPCL